MTSMNMKSLSYRKNTLAMAYNIALRQAEADQVGSDYRVHSKRNRRRMRILWVKVGGLWPANSGGRLRSYQMLKALCENHDVTVMTTHGAGEDGTELSRHLPGCRKVFSFPHSPPKSKSFRFLLALMRSWVSPLPVDLLKNRIGELRESVETALESGQFDLCVADFMFAVPNVPMDGKVPVIFFSHNVEYMIWKRLCENTRNPLVRLLLALEWRKMRRCEIAACRRARRTITVSDDDRDLLGSDSGCRQIASVPTGVDCDFFSPDRSSHTGTRPFEMVFTGSMDWHPNEDAMLYFMESVLPLIRMQVPEATLTIAGRNPGSRLRQVASANGVQVTGTVDDIRPFIEKASVYIVPLRIGGGTRLKIFEALAMGKAVVSTTIGAEGLPLKEGEHILRADDATAFAAAVVSLLRERHLGDAIGRQGRQLVLEHYSWARVTETFAGLCNEVIA